MEKFVIRWVCFAVDIFSMTTFSRTLRRLICTRASNANYAKKVETISNPTVDVEEVTKFAGQAAKWWRQDGAAAPLHRLNPVRLSYIRSAIERNVTSATRSREKFTDVIHKPLSGYDIIDVGCGGSFQKLY